MNDAGQPARPEVAFLIYRLGRGGAERAVFNYVTSLRRHRPLLISLRQNPELADPLPASVPQVCIASSAERGVSWWRECLRIRRVLRERRITTVCSFLGRSNLLASLAKLHSPNLRVVVNVHEHVSRFARFLYPQPAKRLIAMEATRRLYGRADRIICVADFQKDDLVENFSFPADRIQIIRNPLDLEGIRRESEAPSNGPFADSDAPLLVAMGGLRSVKGYDLLIRAFAGLGHDARLLIFGEGVCRPQLEALVEELGLRDRVALPGFYPSPFPYLRRARMLVVSSHSEAFPNAIGEALAVGCPVVATDCSPGIREYLDGGRCGLIVNPGDPDAIRSGIERLLDDPALAQRLAAAGRERVSEFDLPRIVDQYEDMLEDVRATAGERR